MPDNLQQISIYVHIPFCVKKCRYCDFYSNAYNQTIADDFISALFTEWEMVKRKYSLEGIPVSTIYFGGGTPSILDIAQWKRIVENFMKRLPLTDGYEWSIECNPESFSPQTARFWLDSGVTRLTFGIQSLNDMELATLGRSHDSTTALAALCDPVIAKFFSIGADIMFGPPMQTVASLDMTLSGILSIPTIKHLSAYELTIAEATPFGRLREKLPLPDDDICAEMTQLVKLKTCNAGFKQYEVSNYSKPGFRCRHNEAYWRHKPYIGLGPAAHSFIQPYRFSNVKNTREYIARLKEEKLPVDFTETIDAAALSREMIFLGLRTTDGINEDDFYLKTGFGFDLPERRPALEKFKSLNMLEYSPPYWRLNEKGLNFADAVARDLM